MHPGKNGGCHNSFEQSARQPSSQPPSLQFSDLSPLELLSSPSPTASQQSLLESPPSQEVQHSSSLLITSQQLSSPPASSSVCLSRKQCPVQEYSEQIAPCNNGAISYVLTCPWSFSWCCTAFLAVNTRCVYLSTLFSFAWLLIQGPPPTHNNCANTIFCRLRNEL